VRLELILTLHRQTGQETSHVKAHAYNGYACKRCSSMPGGGRGGGDSAPRWVRVVPGISHNI